MATKRLPGLDASTLNAIKISEEMLGKRRFKDIKDENCTECLKLLDQQNDMIQIMNENQKRQRRVYIAEKENLLNFIERLR